MIRRMILMLASLMLCAAVVSGCGSGSAASSPSTQKTDATLTESKTNEGNRAGAAEFRVPGGNKQEVNRIIAGSREASAEEIEAASTVLEKSLEARADHDWATQCRTLSANMEKVVEENGIVVAADQSCAENLGAAGKKASSEALADTMEGAIGALRLIGGGQAFAFYHGVQGKDYLIPMEREGSEWKVGALTAEAIPGS
jgi:hypothetical protein